MEHRYLIIPNNGKPFNTKWFNIDNHYNKGDKVFDLAKGTVFTGKDWEPALIDRL